VITTWVAVFDFECPIAEVSLPVRADPVPDEPSCGRPGITPSLTPATGRIVGGTEARAHSWPWQCSIRYKYSYVGGSPWGQWCGASVLSRHHVLTAAHCLSVTLSDLAA